MASVDSDLSEKKSESNVCSKLKEEDVPGAELPKPALALI
jgi:hypothetical protein